MPHRDEDLARGLTFGPNAEEDQNVLAYDEAFEDKMAEKALQMLTVGPQESGEARSAPALVSEIEDEDDIPQKSYAYDVDFETEMAERAILNWGRC